MLASGGFLAVLGVRPDFPSRPPQRFIALAPSPAHNRAEPDLISDFRFARANTRVIFCGARQSEI
jgi:hypothetical protein